VGDGEVRTELERRAAQLGVGDEISFLGYRTDLPAIAAASDFAVLSSDNEGTPVSLIEAAAAGRPAVATDVGGVSDVVAPDSGILVPPNDPDALAAAIIDLMSDPDKRLEMGRNARERALRRFSADRLIGDMDSLYRELLSRARH
jgi:glycosyltransferase involved in cell wall biosynthesis